MGAVYDVARGLGCLCGEAAPWLRAVGDDVATAWAACDRGDWLAFALVRAGFPVERVVAVVLDAAADVPWVKQKLDAELALLLKYDDPRAPATAALNVYRLFERHVDVPQADLADAVRAAFPFDEVLDAVGAALEVPS